MCSNSGLRPDCSKKAKTPTTRPLPECSGTSQWRNFWSMSFRSDCERKRDFFWIQSRRHTKRIFCPELAVNLLHNRKRMCIMRILRFRRTHNLICKTETAEGWQSGWLYRPGKAACPFRASRVRIPLLPPVDRAGRFLIVRFFLYIQSLTSIFHSLPPYLVRPNPRRIDG